MNVKIRKNNVGKTILFTFTRSKEKELFTLKITNKVLILQSVKMNKLKIN